MARWLPSVSAALVAVATGAGCDPSTLPGTSLGTYSVTGQVTMNSCGAGAMAPDPWTFDVQMSEDGSTLYWSSESEGQTPLSAPIDASSRAILTSVVQQNVDGTAQLAGPCLLERDDTIDLTLGSGSPTVAWADTAFKAMRGFRASGYPSQIRQPILMLAASNDTIVSTPAIEEFAYHLRAGSHLVIAGSKHEILQEQDRYRAQFWAAFDAFVPGTPLFK